MATWLKVALYIPLGLLCWTAGATFWSMLRLPGVLHKRMTDRTALEILLVTRYTGTILEIDPEEEIKRGYAKLLFIDVSSSIKAWTTTRNIAFVAGLVLLLISFVLGRYFGISSAFVLLLTAATGVSTAAEGNVSKDLQVMLGRMQRWAKIDPQGCREYCTKTNAKYFGVMYAAVSGPAR